VTFYIKKLDVCAKNTNVYKKNEGGMKTYYIVLLLFFISKTKTTDGKVGQGARSSPRPYNKMGR
jgi:hypothetical protein